MVVVYIVIVYDVAQERVAKICQFLRRYLNWIQNSVFEGDITESNVEKIKTGIKTLTNKDKDSVIIYTISNRKLVKRDIIGIEKNMASSII